jgi:hypothetical protein
MLIHLTARSRVPVVSPSLHTKSACMFVACTLVGHITFQRCTPLPVYWAVRMGAQAAASAAAILRVRAWGTYHAACAATIV